MLNLTGGAQIMVFSDSELFVVYVIPRDDNRYSSTRVSYGSIEYRLQK